jgi:small multidrug resistance pump
MSSFAVLMQSIAIVAEAIATSALKASDGFSRPLPAIVTMVGYGVAFYSLSLALRTVPVGIAYAVWCGVGIVLVSVTGWVLYGERLDPVAMLGIGLIIAGVLVVNLSSAGFAR